MGGGQALRLGQTWEVVAWEIAQLGSCHFGKYPWKKAFGKEPKIIYNVSLFLSILVNCPVGTFFNIVTRTCSPCTAGSYQDQEAQVCKHRTSSLCTAGSYQGYQDRAPKVCKHKTCSLWTAGSYQDQAPQVCKYKTCSLWTARSPGMNT